MIREYPPAVRARMHDQWRRDERPRPGKHRAIRAHAFVQWLGRDDLGCGFMDETTVRCGYYRKHHPTMLAAIEQT